MNRSNNRRNRSSSRRRRNTSNPTSNRGTKLHDGITENTDLDKDMKRISNNMYKIVKEKFGVKKISSGAWVSFFVIGALILGVIFPGIESILSIKDQIKKEPIKSEITTSVEENMNPIIINSLTKHLEKELLKNEELNKEKIKIKNFYENELRKKDKEIENLNSLLEEDT